jgi:hypothetical protein
MTEPTLTIDEIMETFSVFTGNYPWAAIDAALQQREAVIPRLIQVLEEIVAGRSTPAHEQAAVYAVMLLGHFRATEAHDLIIQAFSLPDDQVDFLFGDTITEDLPMILLRTCGGSVEGMKRLVLKHDAEDFCRGSAAVALTYAVAEGFYPREEALQFLGSLFTGEEDDDPDSAFWGQIAQCVNDLYSAELMPVIRQAFDNDLIEPFVASIEDFEDTVATSSVEQQLERLRSTIEQRSLDDIHDRMSWWASYRPATPAAAAQPPLLSRNPAATIQPNLQTADKAKKKKRKMAKASRKKNRRK